MTFSCQTGRLNRDSATVRKVEDSMTVVANFHFNTPLLQPSREVYRVVQI